MIVIQNKNTNANLNDGNGDPCAGQVKPTEFCTFSSKATRFSLDENFGILLPTGSKNIKGFLICLSSRIYYLKEGNGDPCAGHVNANACNAFSW